MFGKTILSATVVLGLLGGALPALAGYDYDGLYGGPTPTWCDVNPACNGWDKKMGYSSYGYAPSPHHTSHARTHAR